MKIRQTHTAAGAICVRGSCCRLPEEKGSSHCDQTTSDTQKFLPPAPAMNGPDTNAHGVQASRRNHEPHAVKQCALARRKLRAVCMPMKNREESRHKRGNG